MRIKSEYTILSECIERGIELGFNRAHKHNDNPGSQEIKTQIYHAVTSEITDYFAFEEDYGTGTNV